MKRLVSGLLAVAMLVCFASCSFSDSDRKKGREKSDEIKKEKELEETETTTTTTETTETSETEESYYEEPAATTAVPTFAKNEGDISLNLDDVVAATVAGRGSDYKDALNLDYMPADSAEKNLEKGIRNYAYIWRSETDLDNNDIVRELQVNIYIFEVDTTSDMYKNLKVGGMITFNNGYSTGAAAVSAINKQYVLCIYACEKKRDDKTIEETVPEFTLGNAQKGYETFIGLV